ncbi:phosphoribosylamine--glycine ligase [Deminuibacter soli]|uniref:Phosphoribosylamine--glycine ligase n=1 Tax=Deminuibacter soli TaxID=2291815 RepID=A0A3E1NQ27_9BACT|nr:phosphoribosylamine--glycine ligase [Deminuibacter soli]RFM29924.1 phosphoribosylamine--glycine ligase [Deminuibacter soli]
MNILILGSGGREHAFAWKIARSKHCTQLFIAPGNAGTAHCGTNVNIGVNDFAAQKQFCLDNQVNLVLVGPEEPLVKGVYDFFKNDPALSHIKVFGPSANGAQLEGSKAFSKKFMERHAIPTAAYAEFTAANLEEGKAYLAQQSLPIVLKADGLAAGKGVVISQTHEEAIAAFEEMIVHKQFGDASSKVVVEAFLQGIEVSVFVVTDGDKYKIIGHAKDYKRIGEGDTGLNTGGMGCVSPVPFMDFAFMQKVESRIIAPTIAGLKLENIDYKGFVFFGLMNVQGEPFVIEYNCRMGDPETEVVIPRLQNDLIELLNAAFDGTLDTIDIMAGDSSCCTVVAVSGGYPGDYKKGMAISGLPVKDGEAGETIVFHAGTKASGAAVETNGGRVLAVTSFGSSIPEAVAKSAAALAGISFEGMNFRKDIGYEFA